MGLTGLGLCCVNNTFLLLLFQLRPQLCPTSQCEFGVINYRIKKLTPRSSSVNLGANSNNCAKTNVRFR